MYPNLEILVEMRMRKNKKEFVRNEKEYYTISLTVTWFRLGIFLINNI